MRVLLDECVPRQLRRDLEGFDVKTIQEMAGRV
jgi:predicted nuclease of predicted toxin-antitoxin system